MMTKISSFANKHILIGAFIRFAVFCIMSVLSIIDEIGRFERKYLGFSFTYKDVKKLKNKYEGKRCFILCTGPSLTVNDIEALNDEITFGMNSICLFDQKSDFRPTYYGCIDVGVYKKLRKNIINYCKDHTDVIVSNRIKKQKGVPTEWLTVQSNVAYHTYDRWFNNKFWCKFSDDAYAGLYDMFSVTHFLIQIAVYMGFKDIYLLGCDCNQVPGKQVHFKDYGVPDASIDTARERNINGFEEVKRYCDLHEVNVYNATRGGMLDVFERVNLDEII